MTDMAFPPLQPFTLSLLPLLFLDPSACFVAVSTLLPRLGFLLHETRVRVRDGGGGARGISLRRTQCSGEKEGGGATVERRTCALQTRCIRRTRRLDSGKK